MLAVFLALGSAVAWGVADFLGGTNARRYALLGVIAVSQVAGFVVVGAVVLATTTGPPDARYVLFAVLAGLAGAVGITALYRGLAVGAMSIVAPITATGAMIPVGVGIAAGERPSWIQGVGLALALSGVVLASRDWGSSHAHRAPIAAGVGLALLGAVAIGGFLAALDAASEGGVLWTLLVQRLTMIALVVSPALFAGSRLALPFGAIPIVAAIGLLDVGANALFAEASTRGLVSVVAVIASLYPVATVILARFVLSERIGRVQQAGVGGALAGVALITSG
jgi:drug/metabolite transporter (DMT)-like permease